MESPQPVEPKGIACPKCGCRDLRVFQTRKHAGGKVVRIRLCRYCQRKIITTERAT